MYHLMCIFVYICLKVSTTEDRFGHAHSAFLFESYNSELLQMFQGTQGVPIQLLKTFVLERTIPSLTKSATVGCFNKYSQLGLLESFCTHCTRVSFKVLIIFMV